MFYIYSPLGRVFSGPLEQLRKVEKTADTDATRSARIDPLDQAAVSEHHDSYEVSQQAIDQYQQLLQQNKAREAVYHAYQIMSNPVITLLDEDNLGTAYRQFNAYPYQAMPVLNSRHELTGILSRQYLYQTLLALPNNDGSRLSVSQLLDHEGQHQVITADPVTDVRRIAHVLIEKQLSALPIVDNHHHLLGIVSRTDVLRCAVKDPPLSLWC